MCKAVKQHFKSCPILTGITGPDELLSDKIPGPDSAFSPSLLIPTTICMHF